MKEGETVIDWIRRIAPTPDSMVDLLLKVPDIGLSGKMENGVGTYVVLSGLTVTPSSVLFVPDGSGDEYAPFLYCVRSSLTRTLKGTEPGEKAGKTLLDNYLYQVSHPGAVDIGGLGFLVAAPDSNLVCRMRFRELYGVV